MYLKEFEIRWNDIDANRHLANKAYVEYAAHTRINFLSEKGFDQRSLGKFNIGPVVFYEHIYYFKEVFYGKPIRVSLELSGMSEDGKFFEFRQNFYDYKGRNFAHYEMMGAWLDLKIRKLIPLPEEMLGLMEAIDRTNDFRILTSKDTKKYDKTSVDLSDADV
ncbi:thioesterase family protein [uncultured Aquimarina sp.]|uniref:acyl-CoA thioesterase n=1 Tax=uncultured Aquimarina sp. TaxID=575652 RepID=UPI00263161E5|nr:thioesterase family protein [uncultured Aquimarina sp.]